MQKHLPQKLTKLGGIHQTTGNKYRKQDFIQPDTSQNMWQTF